MKVTLMWIGKTIEKYLQEGESNYVGRLSHYLNFELREIPAIKNTKGLSELQIKQKEGELIVANLQMGDFIVLLDENGKKFSSVEFSNWIQKQFLVSSFKRIVFVIGGAYGFDDVVYQRAGLKLSLSEMTFSHQMVRLIFLEQLYRAMTIIKGEPYHHV